MYYAYINIMQNKPKKSNTQYAICIINMYDAHNAHSTQAAQPAQAQAASTAHKGVCSVHRLQALALTAHRSQAASCYCYTAIYIYRLQGLWAIYRLAGCVGAARLQALRAQAAGLEPAASALQCPMCYTKHITHTKPHSTQTLTPTRQHTHDTRRQNTYTIHDRHKHAHDT